MAVSIHGVERILLCSAGSLLVLIGISVYEDEQRIIQSRLVDLWIWLDDRKQQAFSRERNAIARLAGMASLLVGAVAICGSPAALLSYASDLCGTLWSLLAS